MHDARRRRAARRKMAAIDDRARGPPSRADVHVPRDAECPDSADLRTDRGAVERAERQRIARRRAGVTFAWKVRPPFRGAVNFPFGTVIVNVPVLPVGSVTYRSVGVR